MMMVTPEGSIIRMGGPQPKPETDPEWEARKAERKLKRAQSMDHGGGRHVCSAACGRLVDASPANQGQGLTRNVKLCENRTFV